MAKQEPKNQLMGKEYTIAANGSWETIGSIICLTRNIMMRNQPDILKDESFLHFSSFKDENNYWAEILKIYLTPEKDESFKDYHARFWGVFPQLDGIKSKQFESFRKDKVVLSLTATETDTYHNYSGKLIILPTIKENDYSISLGAAGTLYDDGTLIAKKMHDSLNRTSIDHTYKSIDRLV